MAAPRTSRPDLNHPMKGNEMFARKKSPQSKLNEVSCQAAAQLKKLLVDSADSSLKLPALRNLRKLLECMAMGTYQYDVAVARINNAERYLESGEPGAAKFEIRMLFGGLQSDLFEAQPPVTNEPTWVKLPPVLAAVKPVSREFKIQFCD